MTDAPTELDVSVGSLFTTRPDEDAEQFEQEREMIQDLQDALHEQGLTIDLLSQPGVEIWEGSIETLGTLYQLSRMATHLEQQKEITSVLADGPVLYGDELDPAVTNVWDQVIPTRFPHLVYLQGIYSYYLPLDFDAPFWLPFETAEGNTEDAFFGSAVRLQRELVELETLLRTADVPERSSAFQCLLMLKTAAEQSLRHDFPIIVW